MRRKPAKKTGAIFLDRDGVINLPPAGRYISNWDQFRFLPDVLKTLHRLKKRGDRIIVISNQSGVGRGIMTKRQLTEVTRKMVTAIRKSGGHLDAVYYCTHHPEKSCRCRKPHPSMLQQAARRFAIDLKKSFFIGDSETDILTGRSVGCRTILVLTGRHTKETAKHLATQPDRISRNLTQAVRWIAQERIKEKP